mgnify:CR=1 FL=1
MVNRITSDQFIKKESLMVPLNTSSTRLTMRGGAFCRTISMLTKLGT